jgi:hypothetical protein
MIKRLFAQNLRLLLSGAATLLTTSMPALAGVPVPAPLAGLAGPYGLLAAGVVYGGYPPGSGHSSERRSRQLCAHN